MLKIYKASAGSGKTFTLAYEYIKILLGVKQDSGEYRLNSPKYNKEQREISNRHRYILAITFTNKATEEMKRRIIEKLDALSMLPVPGEKDADYAAELCREYGCSRVELAEVAAKALRQLLYFYSAFNVTTIDSFFQRVLRTFAFELDRQGDFSVELNDRHAVQTAVNAMLDDFNRTGDIRNPLGKWIVDYIGGQLETGDRTNFFNRNSKLHRTLVGILTNICEETFKPYEAQMKAYLEIDSPDGGNPHKVDDLLRALRQAKDNILQEIKRDVTADLRTLEASGVTLDQLRSGSTPRKYIEEYFSTGKKCTKAMIDNGTLVKVISSNGYEPENLYKKSFKGSDSDKEFFSGMLGRVRKRYYDIFSIESIEKAVGEFALLAFAWRYLINFSADNNTVLLSDTNNMIHRIIGKEDTPFIYERMGENLQSFLIDEFQDTSRMQWTNLKPLVKSGLSENHDSLIIGDEKQSIYRFRNSDSSLLRTQVKEDFPDACEKGKKAGENTNWRSAADIVRFNNTLFTNLAGTLGVDGFGNVCQTIAKKHLNHSGYVEFVPIEEEAAVEAFGEDDAQGLTADKLKRFYAVDVMAEKMRHQHDVLGYSWKDIAVLVNTNEEGATVIDRLGKYGIPVMSEESLYVKRSPAVQLVVDVLKLIAAPGSGDVPVDDFPNSAQLARIMSRFGYFHNKGLTVDEALDRALDSSGMNADAVGIDAIKKRKPSTLPALVETIIREQIVVPGSPLRFEAAYLTAFLDYVNDYCSKYNPTLKAFLDVWEAPKNRPTVSSASDLDAVNVMTIHKSKGLEFDCVHIPFGSWDLIGKSRGQWIGFPAIPGVDKELCPPAVYLTLDERFSMEGSLLYGAYMEDRKARIEDTINKTYVAYTRASEQLFVYYDPRKGIGENVSDAMNIGLKDLDGNNPYLTDISQHYNSEDGSLVMGEILTKEEARIAAGNKEEKGGKEDADGTIRIDEYTSPDNPNALVITQVADVLDSAPEEDGEAVESMRDHIDIYADEEARRRGIMLHDVLSRIHIVGDIDRAVDSYGVEYGLTFAERETLLATLRDMLDMENDHIRRWFDDNERVLCEQSVHDSGESWSRIDRLVFFPDGSVEVVDYKFTSERPKYHRKQVLYYMGLIRKMGYREVRGYLWYPFLADIEEVKPE